MVRILHRERPGRRSRRLVLRHLLDVSQSARRVGHHSIAQVIGLCTIPHSIGPGLERV